MNLSPKIFVVVLLAVFSGATVGYVICWVLQQGFVRAKDLSTLGLIFGGIGGAGVAVVALVIRAAYDPNAEAPRTFTNVNGIGSRLFGKSDIRQDGSYISTEWFTFFFIPIFPICSYRVIKTDGTILGSEYDILEKFPPSSLQVMKGYLVTLRSILLTLGLVVSLRTDSAMFALILVWALLMSMTATAVFSR